MLRSPLALCLGAALGATAACLDVSSPTGTVTSIAMALPAPSVVVGDVSRDSLGRPAPLRVIAYGPAGDTLHDVKSSFFVLDSVTSDTARVLTIDAAGNVRGLKVGTARIVGSAGTLQTGPTDIRVTVPPGKLTTTVDTVRAPSGTDTLALGTINVKLTGAGKDSTAGAVGFIVDYHILYAPASRSGGTAGVLVGNTRRESTRDTTDASGGARHSVGLNVRTVADASILIGKRDSIVVQVTVQGRGATIAGNPARVVVPVAITLR